MKFCAKLKLKAAHVYASFFLLLPLFLCACGDLGADPMVSDARFSRQFRYYYVQECRYDSFGLYDCDDADVLSSSYVVRLKVDGDGFASLNLDGNMYYYSEWEYEEGYDDYGSYYYFYESDDALTIYKNGEEMIYWDTWNNTATVYSYDLPYN